ncbi:MAG: hypothetical protein WCY42_04880, partial [Candidatus Omnitrophota bacterium]
SGLISTGLSAISGDYDSVTGKNNWGLTKIQMSTLNFIGTTTLYGALTQDWKGAGTLVNNWAGNYTSFGGTSPIITGGARGWSEMQYIEKISQLAGISDFKANADYLMKQKGYSDWNKFIDDGNLSSLTPSISYSLVNYAQSSLHYASVNNISATMEWLPAQATYYLGIGNRWRDTDKAKRNEWGRAYPDWDKNVDKKQMQDFIKERTTTFASTDIEGNEVFPGYKPEEVGSRQYFDIDGFFFTEENKKYTGQVDFYDKGSGYKGYRELGGWTEGYYNYYYNDSVRAAKTDLAQFLYKSDKFEIMAISAPSNVMQPKSNAIVNYTGFIKDNSTSLPALTNLNLYSVLSHYDKDFYENPTLKVVSIKAINKGLPIEAAKTADWTVLGDSLGNLRTVKPAMDTKDFTKNYDVEVTLRKPDGSLESIRGRQDDIIYGHKIAELEKGDILALDETIKPSHDFSRQGTIEIMGLNKGIFFDTYKSVARFGEGQGVNGVTRMENGRLNENSWFLTPNNKGDMRLVYKTAGDRHLLSGVYGNLYKRNSNVIAGDGKSFVSQEYTLKDLAGSKYESAATDILSRSYNQSGKMQESKVSGQLVSVIDAQGQMVDAFRAKDEGELYYAITKKGNDPADKAELERLRLTFKDAGVADEKIDTFKALSQASIQTLYVNPSNNYSVNSIGGQFTTINWGEGLSPNLENINAKLTQDTYLTSTKESYTNLIYHSRINTAEDGVIKADEKRAFSINDSNKEAYMKTYEGKVLYADKTKASTNISQISNILRWDTDKIEGMTLAGEENISAVKSFVPADLKKIESEDVTRVLDSFVTRNFEASGDFKHLGAKITGDKNNYRDFSFYTIGEKTHSGDIAISTGEVYLDGKPKAPAESKTFYSNLPESLENETYIATNKINRVTGEDRSNNTFTLALLGQGESNVMFYTMGGFGAEPRVPTANEALPSWLKVDVSPAEKVDFNINTSNKNIKATIQEMINSKTAINTDKPVTVEKKDLAKLILNIGNDNSGAVYALYAYKADAAQSWAQYGNTGWLGEGKYYNYQLRGLNTPYFGDVKFGSLQDTKGQDVKGKFIQLNLEGEGTQTGIIYHNKTDKGLSSAKGAVFANDKAYEMSLPVDIQNNLVYLNWQLPKEQQVIISNQLKRENNPLKTEKDNFALREEANRDLDSKNMDARYLTNLNFNLIGNNKAELSGNIWSVANFVTENGQPNPNWRAEAYVEKNAIWNIGNGFTRKGIEGEKKSERVSYVEDKSIHYTDNLLFGQGTARFDINGKVYGDKLNLALEQNFKGQTLFINKNKDAIDALNRLKIDKDTSAYAIGILEGALLNKDNNIDFGFVDFGLVKSGGFRLLGTSAREAKQGPGLWKKIFLYETKGALGKGDILEWNKDKGWELNFRLSKDALTEDYGTVAEGKTFAIALAPQQGDKFSAYYNGIPHGDRVVFQDGLTGIKGKDNENIISWFDKDGKLHSMRLPVGESGSYQDILKKDINFDDKDGKIKSFNYGGKEWMFTKNGAVAREDILASQYDSLMQSDKVFADEAKARAKEAGLSVEQFRDWFIKNAGKDMDKGLGEYADTRQKEILIQQLRDIYQKTGNENVNVEKVGEEKAYNYYKNNFEKLKEELKGKLSAAGVSLDLGASTETNKSARQNSDEQLSWRQEKTGWERFKESPLAWLKHGWYNDVSLPFIHDTPSSAEARLMRKQAMEAGLYTNPTNLEFMENMIILASTLYGLISAPVGAATKIPSLVGRISSYSSETSATVLSGIERLSPALAAALKAHPALVGLTLASGVNVVSTMSYNALEGRNITDNVAIAAVFPYVAYVVIGGEIFASSRTVLSSAKNIAARVIPEGVKDIVATGVREIASSPVVAQSISRWAGVGANIVKKAAYIRAAYLTGSIAGAAVDMNYPLVNKIGGWADITGTILAPGRQAISALSSRWANQISENSNREQAFRNRALDQYYGGFAPAFLLSFTRTYLSAATGALAFRTILSPKETLEGLVSSLKAAKDMIGGKDIPSASSTEIASLIGGVWGLKTGFNRLSRSINNRFALDKASTFEDLTKTQQFAYVISQAHAKAPVISMVSFNVGVALALSGNPNSDTLMKLLYNASYNVENMGRAALGLSLIFQSAGALSAKLSKIASHPSVEAAISRVTNKPYIKPVISFANR